MNCQKAGELLSAYIDGEVNGRESEALEAHLGHCTNCCEELETLHSAIALLEAPKTQVRPEGLLEEFKAKYLPEAEAAPAPRWGIRLPVIPRFEWPSLGQMLVPMGAAAAAAALVVGLHRPPMVGPGTPGGSPSGPARVASLPARPALSTNETIAPEAARVIANPAPERTPAAAEPVPNAGTRHAIPPGRHHRRVAAAFAVRPRRHRPHWAGDEPGLPPVRRRAPRAEGYVVANRVRMVPPVSDAALEAEVRRHEQAVPSPEMQWQDQVVMIRRQAAVAPTDDGYAAASYKDASTGEVTRSAAIGTPTEPPAPPAAPVTGDSGAGK